MQKEERDLTVNTFLEHLRRHPMPELISDECMAAFSSIQRQYGNVKTYGAGLEVRLGNPQRYVDYIMCLDEDKIPGVTSLWYEIDYEEFKRATAAGDKICPCLFANTTKKAEEFDSFCDQALIPFLGEKRAKNLRPALEQLTQKLPEEVVIKQIGTMSSRGELDVMRLVIRFPEWDIVPQTLKAIGWQGDAVALSKALAPWHTSKEVAVNIDLGVNGVLPKIGFEVFGLLKHPVLVDQFLGRLEGAGLCLPEKKKALSRWIRIRPDGDPFIQPLIHYFKLNYKDGKIVEAKAYLEQSFHLQHTFFNTYDRPVRMDMELSDGKHMLPLEKAEELIASFAKERGIEVRFFGNGDYADMEKLLAVCRDCSLEADSLLPEGERRRWTMSRHNVSQLLSTLQEAEKAGAKEMYITESRSDTPGAAQIKEAAEIINAWKGTMKVFVEGCFSRLRTYMGGSDPKKNPNRGIWQGCEAGRTFFAVRADGSFVPCLELEGPGEKGTIVQYWEHSPALKALRQREQHTEACLSCPYSKRCLPCPRFVPAEDSCNF